MNVPPLLVRIVGEDASAVAALRRVRQGAAETRSSVSALSTATRRLARDVATLAGAGGLSAIVISSVRAAVQLESLRRGLEAVSLDAAEAGAHLRDLTEIARLPGIGFQEAIRAAQSMRSLGRDVQSTNRVLREFSNAVALGGGGRQQLALTILQLNQMAAAGKVLMTDLRPMIQQAPVIGRAVQRAFGTIQPQQINELGITFEEFLDRVLDELEQMPRAPRTALTAFENLGDALFRLRAAAADTAMPEIRRAVEGLASAADFAAKNMQTLADAVISIGEVGAVAIGSRLIGSLISSAQATRVAARAELERARLAKEGALAQLMMARAMGSGGQALLRQRDAVNQLRAAQAAYNAALARTSIVARAATAATAGLRSVLAFFGGPIGLAITGLSAAFILLRRRAEEAARAEEEAAKRQQERLAKVAEFLGRVGDEEKQRTLDAIRASNERVAALRKEVEQQLKVAEAEERRATARLSEPFSLGGDRRGVVEQATEAQRRANELRDALRRLDETIAHGEGVAARLQDLLTTGAGSPDEAQLSILEARAKTLTSILESQRAAGESTAAVMAQIRDVHQQTLELIRRHGNVLDSVTARALALRGTLADALAQPVIDAARERIRLAANDMKRMERALDDVMRQLPTFRDTLGGIAPEAGFRALVERAEADIGRLPRPELPAIQASPETERIRRARAVVERALEFGLRPSAMTAAERAEFEAAIQTLREYREAQEEVTRALEGARISIEALMGAAGVAANVAVGLARGTTTPLGAAGSLAGAAAGLFSGPLGVALGAASIGLGVADALFGRDSREREDEMFRAHLRALRQAAEEQIIDVTIVLPDTLDPQNPLVQERLGETVEAIARGRKTRVRFESRAGAGRF